MTIIPFLYFWRGVGQLILKATKSRSISVKAEGLFLELEIFRDRILHNNKLIDSFAYSVIENELEHAV